MGTIDPPPTPRPAEDRDAESAWSTWTNPALLLIAVGFVAWGAYQIGHRQSAPAPLPTPPAATDTARVVYVPVPVHAAPGSAAPSALPAPVTVTAAPAAPLGYEEERRRATAEMERESFAMNAAAQRAKAEADAAALQAKTDAATEALWRGRYIKLRDELNTARADLNAARATNPPVYNKNGDLLVVAETQRNATISPYEVKVATLEAEMARLLEDCQRAGCQPGWVRGF